jgi:hypothetical protein
MHGIDRGENYVLRKLQRRLSSLETWYERLSIKNIEAEFKLYASL